MVNIFSITIWLLGYKLHPYSMVIFLIALYAVMSRLSGKPFHIRLMISMGVCMTEYYFGEILIGLICGRVVSPDTWISGFILYSLVLIGIISILSIMNDRFHFFNPNWKMFGLLLLAQVIIVVGLFASGYIVRYNTWAVRQQVADPHNPFFDLATGEEGDPHNWQLALQQLIWYTMWVPLIGGAKHQLSDGQVELHRKKMEEKIPFQRWWHDHKVSEVMKLIPDGNDTVLDLGCGCGDMFVPLQGRGKNIIGLDNDPEIIEYLEHSKDLTGIRLLKEDAVSTGLRDDSVDVVLALDVLEHLDNPKDCLREINRVLKLNGILILSVPHDTLLWRVVWWLWTTLMPYGEHGTFSKKHVWSMLEESGMDLQGTSAQDIQSTHFGCLLIAVAKKDKEGVIR